MRKSWVCGIGIAWVIENGIVRGIGGCCSIGRKPWNPSPAPENGVAAKESFPCPSGEVVLNCLYGIDEGGWRLCVGFSQFRLCEHSISLLWNNEYDLVLSKHSISGLLNNEYDLVLSSTLSEVYLCSPCSNWKGNIHRGCGCYDRVLCAIAQGFDGGKEHHFLFRYWPWRHLRRLCRGSGGLTSFAFGFALLLLMMMCLPCGRGDYGLWTAFLVFLVRLFYSIPGELELPLLFLLLVIISPYQALNLRGTQAGMVISIAVAAYLAFQHFSRAGGLKKALDQETV